MSPITRRALTLLALLATAAAPQRLGAQESRPGWEFGVRGILLMNSFQNDASVNSTDVPAFAVFPGGTLPQRMLGTTLRQTRIVGTGDLAGFAGGALHAELDVDFFGATSTAPTRTGPALRIRRMFGEARWDRVSLLVGQEGPLVADVNPMSLAALGIPNYAAAGNLWLWIPQVRLGFALNQGGGARVGIDVAALSPSTPEGTSGGGTPTTAEASGRPMLESRLRARWGEGGEIGIGGHIGWYAAGAGDSLFQTNAIVLTAVVPLGAALELRGEWFTGKGTASLGGGGIGQLTGTDGSPLKSSGGWGQVNYRAGPRWEVGAGYGFDHPDGSAVDEADASFKIKNAQYSARIQWRLAPAVVAFEYRHFATEWGAGNGERTASHLHLAMGVEF